MTTHSDSTPQSLPASGDEQAERNVDSGTPDPMGPMLRWLLAAPVIFFGAIFAFIGLLALESIRELAGVLLAIAAIFFWVAWGVIKTKRPVVLAAYVTAGVLLAILGLILSTMKMPTR